MKGTLGLGGIVLLVALLVFTGCGGPDEAEDPEEEPAEDVVAVEDENASEIEEEAVEETVTEDEDAVYFDSGEYALPETFPEFVATFKEIQYTGGDVDGPQTTVSYNHLGVEEIDGVKADKVEFGVEGEGIFTIWIDSDGNFQKVIVEGEEIPIEMASHFAEPIKSAVMAPFHHVTRFNLDKLFQESIPGFEQKLIDTRTEMFGDQSVTVYTVEFSVNPPAVKEELAATALVEIADFDDFQAVTYWETTEPYEGGGKGLLKIDELILR